MVTAEEIASIAVFADLGPSARERVARAAADVTLVPGEFAAQEGEERALFALLEGSIEAVKTVDGVERVVGGRRPGEIFGEVPITLGTLFPVGFRAAERSRVLRLGPQDYHAAAAVCPEIGRAVGALAAHRISGPAGLQGIAADAPPARVLLVGERVDPAGAQLRHFLDRNQVSFVWLRPDKPDAEAQWDGPLPDANDWPVVRVIGGKTVVRPQLRRVA